MEKMMTLEVLSSIKGAKSSEAINKLFQSIKEASPEMEGQGLADINVVSVEDLRDDVVIESSELEKKIIRENFPKEKNAYLVVAKVMED